MRIIIRPRRLELLVGTYRKEHKAADLPLHPPLDCEGRQTEDTECSPMPVPFPEEARYAWLKPPVCISRFPLSTVLPEKLSGQLLFHLDHLVPVFSPLLQWGQKQQPWSLAGPISVNSLIISVIANLVCWLNNVAPTGSVAPFGQHIERKYCYSAEHYPGISLYSYQGINIYLEL